MLNRLQPLLLLFPPLLRAHLSVWAADNASNEAGFKIYRSLSASSGFVEVGETGANVRSFTNNSLQEGTTYYYKVRLQ